MDKNTAILSERDRIQRDYVLNENMWHVIFSICTPLALYQSLNLFFKLLDSMMAAHISAECVSAVAYLSQINMMLSALGGGLAVGAGIKISESYGAARYDQVKKQVNTLFAICGLFSAFILLLIVPFTTPILKFANTPDKLISIGSQYFIIGLLSMVVGFFNNIYIAVERARGNSKRILYLNLYVLFIKLGCTAFFVYILNGGINMIAIATLISELALLLAALYNLRKSEEVFGFSLKSVSFRGSIVQPMLHLSFPVIVEKVAFSFGKVVINSMSTSYGVLTVGALGISNNMGGITTNPQNGFQEGGAAIISQNLGAGKPQRALDAFKKLLIINLCIGLLGFALTNIFIHPLCGLFASNDEAFAQLIASVYHYEAMGVVPLGITAAVMALLYGFGYTRLSLLINFCRVFLFRIPILYGLQHFTSLGSESVGIVMMISNILVGTMSSIVAAVVIHRICTKQNLIFFKTCREGI